ncbi:MAG: hypothetical protein FWE27_01260 [Defluviitaleaceae bacterium]|nr:hypothetical protein [Defluviitaleaceae bacterium]
MANSNEKMRVLDLLEAGQINAAEAAELISVLNAPRLMNKETRENVEEKIQQFAKDCNKFAKEVGCKLQEAYKNAEPKIKKASKSALEKAADALDNLACSINESLEDCESDDDDDCCGNDDVPVEN